MSALKLNTVKASQLSQLHTLPKLLLALLNLLQGHLVRGRGEITTEVSHFLAAADCRGSPGLQAKGHLAVGCSTSMVYLNKDEPFLLVDSICDFSPSFGLLKSVEIS